MQINKILKESKIDEKCAYLEDAKQTTHYKVIHSCSTSNCESLIERGWRRFGSMFFRPVCKECNRCESIKIDINNYQFTKSQRRVMRKNIETKIVLQKPQLTQTHLNLFEKYHLYMKKKRDWSHEKTTAEHYYSSFVHGYGEFGYEVSYYINNNLVGVDLIDILPKGISSIYFYYDPDFSKYSLGTFSMLYQIILAKQKGLRWIYLGYYVKGCQSLEYKSRYKPYLTLQENSFEDDEPIWK